MIKSKSKSNLTNSQQPIPPSDPHRPVTLAALYRFIIEAPERRAREAAQSGKAA